MEARLVATPTAEGSVQRRPGEYVLARSALVPGALMAVVATSAAGLLRGAPAALTALGGVALVLVWFVAAAASIGWAGRFGPAAVQAVALGGFLVRVLLLGVALLLLRPVEAIDGPVLAVTVSVGVVLLLAYEVRVALSHPSLWWLEDGKDGA